MRLLYYIFYRYIVLHYYKEICECVYCVRGHPIRFRLRWLKPLSVARTKVPYRGLLALCAVSACDFNSMWCFVSGTRVLGALCATRLFNVNSPGHSDGNETMSDARAYGRLVQSANIFSRGRARPRHLISRHIAECVCHMLIKFDDVCTYRLVIEISN